MCLKSVVIAAVPEETARVVRAIYPKGNLFMEPCLRTAILRICFQTVDNLRFLRGG